MRLRSLELRRSTLWVPISVYLYRDRHREAGLEA